MPVTLTVENLFVVVIEYGERRSPQVIGPFLSYGEAAHYCTTQTDPRECARLGYYRPHSHPGQFKRMAIKPIKPSKIT